MRIRRLAFNDGNKESFQFIYQGFLIGGNGPQPKGMEVLRREVRILDKLEEISNEAPAGERQLKPGDQEVVLEQPEYEMLRRYFENTPWTTQVARKIVAISDWLSDIPAEESSGR